MKYFLLFLVPIFGFSQDEILTIDLNNDIQNQEILVKKEKYKLRFIAGDDVGILEFKMSRGVISYGELALTVNEEKLLNSQSAGNIIETELLNFKDNTRYTFLIKIEKNGVIQNRSYVIKSQSTWSWSSTFGINSIFLLNNDTYKTLSNDTQFQIIEDNGQDIIEYVPSIMFTFMDKSKNVSFGVSGGLGFDLEQISVFTGLSLGVGKNLIITGGVAFHNQESLDSKYSVNMTVDSALRFEDLHTRYYRFNPFISLSLRLDKSPFKS
jgi:hypothetical protein